MSSNTPIANKIYNNTITYMKAIGIILMVFMHCTNNFPHLRNFIYMFHMPLFFFVAGYCFKASYLNSPLNFITKRMKSIWWPYAKFCGLLVLFHNVFIRIHVYSTENIQGVLPVEVFSDSDMWIYFQ